MPTEEIINQEPQVEQEVDAVQMITELRANTVPKDKYNKLVEDNAKLMKALANGETLTPEQAPEKPNIEELRAAYLNFENKSDLQIATDTLALRNALIEDGQPDPFLPNGNSVELTEQDYVDAQRVADLLQYAIDNADGDDAIFRAQFSSKLVDTVIPGKKKTTKR